MSICNSVSRFIARSSIREGGLSADEEGGVSLLVNSTERFSLVTQKYFVPLFSVFLFPDGGAD